MKRAAILLAALAIVLAGCTNSFTPAAPSSAVISTETAALVAQKALTNPVFINVSSSGLVAGATPKGHLTLQINNAVISLASDMATLKAALAVYPLATSTATTAYTRGTAIALPDPVVTIANNSTTLDYAIDMSAYSTTTGSPEWEIYIPGDKLTVSGVKVLDLDNNQVLGEASPGPDDYIGYVTIFGTSQPLGAGNPRNPRAFVTYGPPVPTSTTVSTITFNDNGVIPGLTGSTIIGLFSIETFDPTSLTWKPVAATNTYDTATAVMTITLGAALPNGNYREVVKTPYLIAETTAVNDYKHSADYGKTSVVYPIGVFSSGTNATESTATFSASAQFDGAGKNGYILLTFNGLGAQGLLLSSLTTTTVQLYDTNNQHFVPLAGFFILPGTNNAGPAAVVVRANLPASYTQVGHSYLVSLSSGVIDSGATTATSDDLNLGRWTNVPGSGGSSFPYLCQNVNGSGGSI